MAFSFDEKEVQLVLDSVQSEGQSRVIVSFEDELI